MPEIVATTLCLLQVHTCGPTATKCCEQRELHNLHVSAYKRRYGIWMGGNAQDEKIKITSRVFYIKVQEANYTTDSGEIWECRKFHRMIKNCQDLNIFLVKLNPTLAP